MTDRIEPQSGREGSPTLTVIVPVFNEEETVARFLEVVEPILQPLGCQHRYLFVDDGSRDRTVAALRALQRENPRVSVVVLSRNFGKEAALTAGLDQAEGDLVVIMDVDLQDPPELIETFLERWREGYDIAFGLRSSRESDSLTKRITAKAFYSIFNAIAREPIPFNAGDYRMMDRKVVLEIRRLRERNRFMKGLMAWPGFKSIAVPFVRPPREAGKTSWNYWKLWNFALDGITGFSMAPLRFWLYVGASIAFISLLFAVYILVKSLFFGTDVPGYASLMIAIAFFGGIQLLTLGLIGEYLGRIFQEVKQRPIYVIDEVLEAAEEEESRG